MIEQAPQRSVRNIIGDIANNSSRESVYRILKYDLKLTPYTISIIYAAPGRLISKVDYGLLIEIRKISISQNVLWFPTNLIFI